MVTTGTRLGHLDHLAIHDPALVAQIAPILGSLPRLERIALLEQRFLGEAGVFLDLVFDAHASRMKARCGLAGDRAEST